MFRIGYFNSVEKLIFGLNAAQKIGEEAKILGEDALIVTDKTLEKLGVVGKISEILKDSGLKVDIFNECEAEPRLEIYEKAKDFVRQVKPNIVIGVGGGSNMDIAKIASILATNDGEAAEYIFSAPRKYEKDRLPIIQVTTTAGTGSEVTPFAVVTVKGEKWDFKGELKLLCDVAIVDPNLTLSMPPGLTASTAIDALSHAVESILSLRANLFTMPYALRAIRMISKFVGRAYADGEDIEARYRMPLAATCAGISLCNAGIVLGHAVAYTFSAQHNLPHGVACGIALPYIMEYNMPLTQKKLLKIGQAMGLRFKNQPLREAATSTIVSVKNLIRDLEMPTSMKEVNIPRNEVVDMVERLLTKYTYLSRNNPRRRTREKLEEMYERIWEGRLEAEA